MTPAYAKEKKKFQILLGVGVFLMVVFLIGTMKDYGVKETLSDIFEFNSLIILTAITFYPVGIVYGWRRMVGWATYTPERAPADRYYTVQERTIYKSGNMMTWFIQLGLVISFGWIFGTITAFKRLNYLKKNGY